MSILAQVAFCGPPGAGKSTARRQSQQVASSLGFTLHHFRLADPLYEAQTEIYRIAGRPMIDVSLQDGRLLSVLGVEMRRINPTVLADHARARMLQISRAGAEASGNHIIVCDDMRPPDAEFMRDLGFSFVLVQTTAQESLARRKIRGDLTLGSTDDPNEQGLAGLQFDHVIENNGSVEQLKESLARFLGGYV